MLSCYQKSNVHQKWKLPAHQFRKLVVHHAIRQYIYALYAGYSRNEKDKNKNVQSRMSIFIFKHNGTPVCKYNLNARMKAFDVDEKNGLIYALQSGEKNKVLKYRYEIP